MPRHSYRKSISKPFLPLARALSLPKQDRGISNTSIRATIVREALAAYENGDLADEKPASSQAQLEESNRPTSSDASQPQVKPTNPPTVRIAPLSPENWPLAISPAQKPDADKGDCTSPVNTTQEILRPSAPKITMELGLADPKLRILASRRIPTCPPSSYSSTSALHSPPRSIATSNYQAVFHPAHQRRSKSVSLLPSKSAKLDAIAEGADESVPTPKKEAESLGAKGSRRSVASQHARFRSASVGNLAGPLSKIDEETSMQRQLGPLFDNDDEEWQLLTLRLRKGVPPEQPPPVRSRTRLRSAFDAHSFTNHLSLPSFLHHQPPLPRSHMRIRKPTRKRYCSANDAAVEELAVTSPVIPLPRSPTAAHVWSSQLQQAIEYAGHLSSSLMESQAQSERSAQPEAHERTKNESSASDIALHSKGMSSCPELSLSSTVSTQEHGFHSADTTIESLDIDLIDYHSRCRTSSFEGYQNGSTGMLDACISIPTITSKEAPSDTRLPESHQKNTVPSAVQAQHSKHDLSSARPLSKRHVTFASYTYGVNAQDTREPLMLLPRDLNQDLHVKPWLITLPQRMLAERGIGVRDWDRDRLENWYKQEEGPCVQIGRLLPAAAVRCKERCKEPGCEDCRERCAASALVS